LRIIETDAARLEIELEKRKERMSANIRRGPAIEPCEIAQEGDAGLRITWGDERVCRYTAPTLRGACPCAQCVNEWTGERLLRPETISAELTIADMNVVGRYALSFRWSDGHEHGIYSFKYLRELCEQDEQESDKL
jgi:DUF971 family protein